MFLAHVNIVAQEGKRTVRNFPWALREENMFSVPGELCAAFHS